MINQSVDKEKKKYDAIKTKEWELSGIHTTMTSTSREQCMESL